MRQPGRTEPPDPGLEDRLGIRLFHRLPRGVALTDEGAALYPVLNESFERISASIARYTGGPAGKYSRWAWWVPCHRLAAATAGRVRGGAPDIELRLQTHNNRIDLAGEGLDLAIRFGDGDWQGQACTAILDAPFAPLCAPALARRRKQPRDLATLPLLRSYRSDEWPRWLQAAGVSGGKRAGRCSIPR